MCKYLDKLNDKQREAAMHTGGPLLIVAGAGSGKTTVLINRVAYLVDQGVDPEKILLLTFTNNAADNMVERAGRLSNEECKKITACTYHSFCASELRRYHKVVNLNKDFTIIMPSDEAGVLMMAKAALKLQHLKNFPPAKKLVELRSLCINKCLDLEEMVNFYYGNLLITEHIMDVFREADRYKEEKNLLNYDDLLLKMNELLENDRVRDELETRFQYVMVDEYQDTNALQESIVFKMTEKNKNLAVVGDDYQCWHKDCTVVTENGTKTIADLQIGDKVQTILKGKVQFADVTNKSRHTAKTIAITTESGKQIRVTKNHKMFASQPDFDGSYYVYLMYCEEKGFRIGVTSGGKKQSIFARSQSERADKMWYLGRYKNQSDASFYETYYSLKYQIPQLPFQCTGRNLRTTQEDADKIFDSFGQNGFQLLNDFEMSFNHPNYTPQGTVRENLNRKIVYLQMDAGHKYNHVSYESEGVRIRKYFSYYKDAVCLAEILAKEYDASLIERLFVGDKNYLRTIPASQLTVTMKIPVVHNGEIVLEKIVSIGEESEHESTVYHVEVERTGILIANEIASHNSIYAFRGSDIQNILEFSERIGGCKTVVIDTNYRSTAQILEVANQVMRDNADFGFPKDMKDCGKSGKLPVLECPEDNRAEAEAVLKKIQNWIGKGKPLSEFAVLERQSKSSAMLEALLTREGIPFEKLGGLKFMEHQCVIDMMNFLRIVANPADELAWFGVLDLLPGVGEVYAHKILEDFGTDDFLNEEKFKGKVFYEELKHLKGVWRGVSNASGRIPFIRQFDLLRDRYFDLMQRKIEQGNYKDESYRTEALDQLENDKETISVLRDMAEKYNAIPEFLDSIVLDATPSLNTSEDKLVISTIHSAKGMEWDTVVLLDCMEGITPSESDLEEDEGMESLRCLYVALTRAKKYLFVETPEVVQFHGNIFTQGSHFLDGCSAKGLFTNRSNMKTPSKEKVYLDVSFYEKDDAKKLGAKWDHLNRCWYCYKDDPNLNTLLSVYGKHVSLGKSSELEL